MATFKPNSVKEIPLSPDEFEAAKRVCEWWADCLEDMGYPCPPDALRTLIHCALAHRVLVDAIDAETDDEPEHVETAH